MAPFIDSSGNNYLAGTPGVGVGVGAGVGGDLVRDNGRHKKRTTHPFDFNVSAGLATS